MEKLTQYFLTLTSSIILLLTVPGQTAGPCKPDSCHTTRGPVVRFPFRLARQPVRCGYPGFNLHCNSRNQTILSLPRSGDFIVQHINYRSSAIYIGDPAFCLPSRSLNFSVAGSPFNATYLMEFGILNCSEGLTDDVRMDDYYYELPCLSTRNNTVVAVDADLPADRVPAGCRRAANVSVPPLVFSEFYWGTAGPAEDFELRWSKPACGRCESRGGRCGFKEDSGFEIGCSKSSGLSRSAKYALMMGGGVPGVMCMIGLMCFACRKMKFDRHQRTLNNNELPMSTFDRHFMVRAANGLDIPTIESYPKTVVGQSRRLPNPTDNTCSICLCDYQPEETLKTIPECNHYFHANCIDEWLKLNGTCPLCRNSPETLSYTLTSSTALSSSSSTTPNIS